MLEASFVICFVVNIFTEIIAKYTIHIQATFIDNLYYGYTTLQCGESYPLQSTGASTHGTQAAPYTHARRNRLLLTKRQRGIFRLHVGCANTQWTSGILSPVPQGPG